MLNTKPKDEKQVCQLIDDIAETDAQRGYDGTAGTDQVWYGGLADALHLPRSSHKCMFPVALELLVLFTNKATMAPLCSSSLLTSLNHGTTNLTCGVNENPKAGSSISAFLYL